MNANIPEHTRSREALSASLAAGYHPKWMLFWGHRPPASGRLGASCLSQWWEGADFADERGHYRTAEHYMMAEKARLFGDESARAHILAARTPGEAKKLGRQVAGFDEARWLAARWDVVVAGNMLKFSQAPELHEFLLRTGSRVLVEASPVDVIWGIGLAADHADVRDPAKWKGLNLLGFTLMEVRARLASAEQVPPRHSDTEGVGNF